MPRSGKVHACTGTLDAVLAGTGGFCESPLYEGVPAEPGIERHPGFNRLISNRNSQSHG
jgi:hypothetical protein